MNSLSIRLKTIASLVPVGARVCDIGTDHGYLPIYLKQNNIASRVIACDINQKPLENARKNIEQSNIKDIELRLCNGLSGINPYEIDTIIIAGLGGEVIANILSLCDWIKDEKYILLLQPTTSADALRRFLAKNGFEAVDEPAVCENQKLYSVMKIKYTGKEQNLPEHYYYIGSVSPKTEAGLLYIKKQQKRISECMLSLESIPQKQAEFHKFEEAFCGIQKLLTEN